MHRVNLIERPELTLARIAAELAFLIRYRPHVVCRACGATDDVRYIQSAPAEQLQLFAHVANRN